MAKKESQQENRKELALNIEHLDVDKQRKVMKHFEASNFPDMSDDALLDSSLMNIIIDHCCGHVMHYIPHGSNIISYYNIQTKS